MILSTNATFITPHVADLLMRVQPLRPTCALLPPNAGELGAFERWALTLPGVYHIPGCVLFPELRALLSHVAVRRPPRQVVDGAQHAGHTGRVPVRRGPRQSPSPGLAG